jgi:hypothetical protein
MKNTKIENSRNRIKNLIDKEITKLNRDKGLRDYDSIKYRTKLYNLLLTIESENKF